MGAVTAGRAIAAKISSGRALVSRGAADARRVPSVATASNALTVDRIFRRESIAGTKEHEGQRNPDFAMTLRERRCHGPRTCVQCRSRMSHALRAWLKVSPD